MRKQEYAIFAKDPYGVFLLVRHEPTDKLLEASDVQVIEVKKIPQEITDEQLDERKRELKKQHGPFKKWRL